MKFALRNLSASIQEITKCSLRTLLFWPHLHHVKSKSANSEYAGKHLESLQVDILGVKALLQKNDILLASKSVRVDACPGREWAESVEKGQEEWTSALVVTHQAREDKILPH